jgi:excisionase family DNA binding protein
MDNMLLTTEEVSARYRVSRRTLYYWRATGQAPPAIKIGRHLRWPESQVRDWEDQLAAEQSGGEG